MAHNGALNACEMIGYTKRAKVARVQRVFVEIQIEFQRHCDGPQTKLKIPVCASLNGNSGERKVSMVAATNGRSAALHTQTPFLLPSRSRHILYYVCRHTHMLRHIIRNELRRQQSIYVCTWICLRLAASRRTNIALPTHRHCLAQCLIFI